MPEHDPPREHDWLAERFEARRPALRALAYRMLGSRAEAEDAVQDTWLRLHRVDAHEVDNLDGWLRTVLARVCLDVLRARTARREESLEPDAARADATHPAAPADAEHEAQLADAVGLALLVVLERLTPAERVAFVLHDAFDLSFDEIATIVGRSPAAARQLASRARRRVRGIDLAARPAPDPERARQRAVVEAYLAASRSGDLAALVAVLAPDVVLRVDGAATQDGVPLEVRGAHAVSGRALAYGERARFARPALVDGAVGLVVAPNGRLRTVLALGVVGDRVASLDVIADPARLSALELAVLDPSPQ